MLSQDKIDFFKREGYIVIPGVLSSEEVAHMRKRVMAIFEAGEWKKSAYNTDRILSDVYQTFPEFIDISLKPAVLDAIRSLAGDNPVLMPETAIHHKFYSTWHKDTSTLERAGHNFHNDERCLLLQSGFYMQDNDEFGGGLTIMPGSHNYKDYYYVKNAKTFLTRIFNKLTGKKVPLNFEPNPYKLSIYDVPSKAGDLVIFNMKANHCATFPKKGTIAEVPPSISKIAFFNAFAANNETSKEYLEFILNRNEPYYQSLRNRKVIETLTTKAKELSFTVF